GLQIAVEGVAFGFAVAAGEIGGATGGGAERMQRSVRTVAQEKRACLAVAQADRQALRQRIIGLAGEGGGVAGGGVLGVEVQHLDAAADLRRRVGRRSAKGLRQPRTQLGRVGAGGAPLTPVGEKSHRLSRDDSFATVPRYARDMALRLKVAPVCPSTGLIFHASRILNHKCSPARGKRQSVRALERPTAPGAGT